MQLINQNIYDTSQKLGGILLQKKYTITTAESCTGGGIAQAITEMSGSSQWFNGSFITYSNECKQKLLSVDASVIAREGAVSKAVVCAMAVGALVQLEADVAIAVSGIAGPDGGVPGKPVGTVWIAWAMKAKDVEATVFHFNGDRVSVRQQAIYAALQGVLSRIL